MNSFQSCLERAQQCIDRRQFQSAVDTLREALNLAPDDCIKAFVHYQRGALHWGETGLGECARQDFIAAVDCWEASPFPCSERINLPVVANSCENLMILSLSFDEYFRWAAKLRQVAPREEILHQQQPMVEQLQEEGKSWAEVMMALSNPYVHPDPAQNAGRFGSAACILHLILKNRRTLRLDRDNWRIVVIRYASIQLMAAEANEKTMRRTLGRCDPIEFRLLFESAIPLVEEYVSANPNDKMAVDSLAELKKGLDIANTAPPVTGDNKPPISPTDQQQEGIERAAIIFAMIPIAVFTTVAFSVSYPWNVLAGMIAGYFGLSLIGAILKKHAPPLPQRALDWRSNAQLAAAVQKSGLQGAEFRLVHCGPAVDGSLELCFASLSPLQESQRHPAHLALRCVVGLTYPDVVASLPGYRMVEGPIPTYTVKFADGVTLPAYIAANSIERVGPLQVTSEDAEGGLWVYICPKFNSVNRPSGLGCLADIAAGFLPLQERPLIL